MSGKVSEELARDGALAIVLAMLGIAVYIWFRFEWQFGVGALVTLFHDVSMTLGFFALTQLQVDLNVVAAILDHRRLFAQRHGRHLRPDPRESAQIPQDGDRPAAQPVAQRDAVADDRHLAVDPAGAGVLLILGPDVIFGLTIAIFLGIFVGTYSSIYISAPILVWLGVKPDSFLQGRGQRPGRSRRKSEIRRSAVQVAPCHPRRLASPDAALERLAMSNLVPFRSCRSSLPR